MFRSLIHAGTARLHMPLLLLCGYAVLPLALNLSGHDHPYFRELSALAGIAAASIWVGAFLPVPLHRLKKVGIRPEILLLAIWCAFLSFIVLACVTAERIPLVASLQGADAETIAVLRERFLKARVGWQASFVYVNAIFAGFLIPYCIALMFLYRFKLRWICFLVFLIYSLSFAEKAFFFKAVVPLFYLLAIGEVRSILKPKLILAAMIVLMFLITAISRVGTAGEAGGGEFFSAHYGASGPAEYMLWRAASVPLVTAADSLYVFHERFKGMPQHGATSSLLAAASGRKVVPFERMVFAEQWGQNETGTGSANSVYITEAFVNFGISGVVIFSLSIGLILRLFALSRDPAFQSLWMLFCLNILYAGLIGTLLSNGFLLLLLLTMFIKFKDLPSQVQLTSLKPAALPS